MKKAIIIIGGGYLQCPQIGWAKELGLHVIVTDKKRDVPGATICDEFVNIDGSDTPEFLRVADILSRKYELVGIYSGSDFGLTTVASISEMLSLPSSSLESVNKTLDKSAAKTVWSKENIPIPEGSVINEYLELVSLIKELGLPVIMKPINSSGSRGVISLKSESDLREAYSLSKKYSESILVERIIRGKHIDVNGLFMNGKFIRCGLFERFFSDPPFHYPIWGVQPSSLTSEQEEKTYELLEKAARTLGIGTGPVKADIVYTEDGPCILELAPRFHGDVITSFVSMLTSKTSPLKAWFSHLAGESDPLRFILPPKCCAGWVGLFPSSEGILDSVSGIEEAKGIGGIHDIYIAVKKGARITKPRDNSALCGFIWAGARNAEELHRTLLSAASMINFRTLA